VMAWDKDPQKRPTMKDLGAHIRDVLEGVSTEDETIVNRTQHMLNRSRQPFEGKQQRRSSRKSNSTVATRSTSGS
jgi:hypothetical protein